MAKAIRDIYGEVLAELGKKDERVVVLDCDVSGSTKSGVFGKECPERFYNCGIAEYSMVGMAAGMAKMGKIPFCNTFAVFLTTLGGLAARTFMSYSGLNVKLVGGYAGLSDAFDGCTHHALEDVAIMRTLPGVAVMVASDAATTRFLVETAIEKDMPMYLRMSRDTAEDCHPADAKFEFGKAFTVKEGTDVTIIASGVEVGMAVKAAKILEEKGVNARILDMFTIKPIDREAIIKAAAETGAIVTAEEHSIIGGLGGAVAEVLAQEGCGVPVEMIGMKDTHGESGPYKALLHKYCLDEEAIAAAAEKAVSRKK